MHSQFALVVSISNNRSTSLTRYGWSRARYVYSLISGVGIFFLGSGVSVYHGISDLFSPPVLASLPLVSYKKVQIWLPLSVTIRYV